MTSRFRDEGFWLDLSEKLVSIALAAAAVLTAWSGFQAAKWGGVQANAYAAAGAARTESVRMSNLAGQQTQIDVALFVDWVSAVFDEMEKGTLVIEDASQYEPERGTLSGFLFLRMRDEFKPAIEAWLATDPVNNLDAPPSPFAMPEYQLASQEQADALLQEAESLSQQARDANQTSDNYVLTGVLFAGVLFFGGIANSLKRMQNRMLVLAIGILILLGSAFVLLTFPIEI